MKKSDLIGLTTAPEIISEEYFNALVKMVIYQPFENTNSVSHCFCRKCGMHGEIGDRYAYALIRTIIMQGEHPNVSPNRDVMRMHYFVTGGCEICSPKNQPVTVEIKKISFDV